MNSFAKALAARCEVSMYRVMETIGIDNNDCVLINHGCVAYEHAHDLGYVAFKTGEQPGALIESDAMLLKGWRDGFEDARCNDAIANSDHFYAH